MWHSPRFLNYTTDLARWHQRLKVAEKTSFLRDRARQSVRLIFKLYLDGDGATGPLGVKETTKWLNSHGYRTRRGATFGVGVQAVQRRLRTARSNSARLLAERPVVVLWPGKMVGRVIWIGRSRHCPS
jgi:hypothetical protein